jgi:hypothetical protein
MRTCLFAALVALTAASMGCANFSGWRTVHGSGKSVRETRDVTGFDHVSVSGEGDLTLVQGDGESLTIETDDNLLPLIKSEVENGHLLIGPRDVNLRPTKAIVYRLNLKNLRALDLLGSLRAEAEAIKTDRLALGINGSGKITVTHLEVGALSTGITGSGTTSAGGVADSQEIRITGSGDHRASDLKCSQARVHIDGSGHIWLWVTESLSSEISGSGSVEYRGNASVDSHVSGSGRVRHRGGD